MKFTITTPSAELNFDMAQEKVEHLIHQAFRFSNGLDAETEHSEAARELAPLVQKPLKAQQPPTVQLPTKKPQSRVERMFGDFKGKNTERQAQAPTSEAETPKEGAQNEPELHKGFLLIKCQHCGKVKGFCAKTLTDHFTCECGGTTEYHNLKIAFLHCKCGKLFKYKTNITDEVFDYNCLSCDSPVDLRLNRRGDTYVTIEDE